MRQLHLHWRLFSFIITALADRYDFQHPLSPASSSSSLSSLSLSSLSSSSSSSSSYLRSLTNRDGLIRERDGMHRIKKIYHYDNLTDCESACEIPCGTTYVIRNDVDERRQFICTQRKAPAVSAFINISTTGIVPFVLAAALSKLARIISNRTFDSDVLPTSGIPDTMWSVANCMLLLFALLSQDVPFEQLVERPIGEW
uniref:Uncharacterized protein n=1 Tax=Setaria digitata TaxID=48799 RepID=A0A915Q781_9BILA